MNAFSDFASGSVFDLLLRATVILAAAWLAAGLFPKWAAVRHAILLSGIACTFALPLAMFAASELAVPRWNIEVAADITPAANTAQDTVCLITTKSQETYAVRTGNGTTGTEVSAVDPCDVPAAQSTTATPAATAPLPLTQASKWTAALPLAAALWAAIAAVRLLGLGLSLVRLHSIVQTSTPVDPRSAGPLLARIQRRFGLAQPPELRESSAVATPLAAGILGDYILVPAGWTNALSRTELDSILSHEAAHLARRDHRVVLLQETLASLHWFHPLAHLVNRALTRSREEICDNFAIRSVDRPDYCAALFRLAGGRPANSLVAATSLSSRHWSLEDRIRGILDERRPTVTGISRPARWAIVACAVALCILTTLPAITAAEPEQDEAKQEQSASITASASATSSASASTTTDDVEIRRISRAQSLGGDVRQIRIASRNGDLSIEEANDDQLRAEAIVHIDTKLVDLATIGDKLEDFVQLSVKDGVLTITPLVDVDRRNEGVQVDLSITVPAGLPVEAESHDGDISVLQIEAGLTLTTHDGDIALRSFVSNAVTATSHNGRIFIESNQVTGKAALNTHNGRILVNADRLRGKLNAQSYDGDITIVADTVDNRLDAQTSTGDVTVELTDSKAGDGDIALTTQTGDIVLSAQAAKKISANAAQGDIVIQLSGDGIQQELSATASQGDVEIAVPPQTNADLALVTQSGEITIEGKPAGGNLISTKLGSGGPKYAVVTANGSIVINTVEPQADDDKHDDAADSE